jgi:hypothetical protein
VIDFSQFTPRGHYAEHYLLKNYFRAMMWLGRTELYLLPPKSLSPGCPQQTPQDVQRQTIDAVLLLELMDLAGADSLQAEMEQVFSVLVGEQDNVTPANLRLVIQAMGLENAANLLDEAKLLAFQEALATHAFAHQRILSQVLQQDPLAPENIQPASAFMMFGQRFLIDSYITGNVVYDKIKYNDDFVCRLFPSTLDVLFTLGNDAATQLLIPQLDQYHYAANLAGLRCLIDSYDVDFWNSSVYNMWLNSIRSLNPPLDRGGLPAFMQTGAWWQQKMNTQLASWTELRHDNLLYAKQSYTSASECSYPCAYVEPVPEVYRRLSMLGKTARDKFAQIAFSDISLKANLVNYYDMLATVTDTLRTIAQKELDGTSLDADELSFMQKTLFSGFYGVLDGWYMKLLYGPSYRPKLLVGPFSDYLVADLHTTPTDCVGNATGWVLHAGTGPIDMAIVTVKLPDADTAAFVGPVMSYYEYTTTKFQRLTDEEWQNTYLSLATRPDWVNSYLANDSGEPRSGTDAQDYTRLLEEDAPADFTAVLVLDDFEGYTDNGQAGQVLVQTWTCGWTNGTGSLVGPYTGKTSVHGGQQSMPMDYYNVTEPWYSEAERTWETPQDWTIDDADTLTLYFRGKADNGRDSLYVRIEDSAGRIAVVTHPDADAVLTTEWQKWHIPLADLRVARVDVMAVKKMYIGVGDRENPQPGGAGRIYIDDIQVVRRIVAECLPSSNRQYEDWVALGKPRCWCAPPDGSGYQCDGDADGGTETAFRYRIYSKDSNLIVQNWKKKIDDPTLNPCADIDHKAETVFKYRVYTKDLSIIVTNWKKTDAALPGDCPRPE